MHPLAKCLLMVFHPLDCCDIIKREHRRGRGERIIIPLFLYILAFLANYAYIFVVHFPLSEKSIVDANVLMEAAMVIVPLFSWVVCSYAMTSISSGESTFRENLAASGYCLVPYIVLTPLLGLFSNLLSLQEAGIFSFLRIAVLLWTILLLLVCLKHMNDYTLMKTARTAVLSVLAVIVMWAVCLLTFSLTIQVVVFFTGIGEEINLKYFV